MISDFPAQGAFETGRVATGRHMIDDLPITSAVVYGFAQGPTYPNAKTLTDQLLSTVTKEVVLGMQGVRIIAGDFNMTAGSSPQIAIWRQHGWQEAQQLARSLWQQTPGSPVRLPHEPPAHQQAVLIFQDFRQTFKAWHANKRKQAINLKFEESNGVLYNFIKEDKAPPIDKLAIARDYTILAVDPSNSFVHLDKAIYAKGSFTWSLHAEPAHAQLETADVAQVDSDRLLCPGDTLEQNASVSSSNSGHPVKIPLRDYPRTNSNASPTSSMPSSHVDTSRASPYDWDIALKKYRPHTAKGPDAFALNDLRNMQSCTPPTRRTSSDGSTSSKLANQPHQHKSFRAPSPRLQPRLQDVGCRQGQNHTEIHQLPPQRHCLWVHARQYVFALQSSARKLTTPPKKSVVLRPTSRDVSTTCAESLSRSLPRR